MRIFFLTIELEPEIRALSTAYLCLSSKSAAIVRWPLLGGHYFLFPEVELESLLKVSVFSFIASILDCLFVVVGCCLSVNHEQGSVWPFFSKLWDVRWR